MSGWGQGRYTDEKKEYMDVSQTQRAQWRRAAAAMRELRGGGARQWLAA